MENNNHNKKNVEKLPQHSQSSIIVKLKKEAVEKITTSIPTKPQKYVTEIVSEFGFSDIDTVCKSIGVKSLRCLGKSHLSSIEGEENTAYDDDPMSRTFVVKVDTTSNITADLKKLQESSSVEEVDYDYLNYTSIIPNDPMYPQQWGLERINCPEAWNKVRAGRDVKVAIVDSGIDLDHPDLVDNLISGFDFVDIPSNTFGLNPGQVAAGIRWVGDFNTRDNTPDDDTNHGTHVAGTVAARTNNSVGVAGVAWNCAKLMPVRVMASLRIPNPPGRARISGAGFDSDIGPGIRWAADNGAEIINMSFGGPNSMAKRDAIDYAFSKNCVLVAAMGNDNTSTPSYPAAYDKVLAVGSTDITDSRSIWPPTGGSNTGSHIDVVAPGTGILSTIPDGRYARFNGTSMAAPHVAGLAALIRCCASSYSNTRVYDIIRNTARELGGSSFNNEYGHGIVDAEKAVNQCPIRLPLPDLCDLFPWLPRCNRFRDICERFPWICRIRFPQNPLDPFVPIRQAMENGDQTQSVQNNFVDPTTGELETAEKQIKELLEYLQTQKSSCGCSKS